MIDFNTRISEFDIVELKDGTRGTIVHVYERFNDTFELELQSKHCLTISKDDIKEVLK